ncbi:hypothetical protein E2C01_055540 [Portunus trituberculatus]|uniref:Uncharacterized protein n=1 Tax=Portunus trituberculatus TaxID=210409 RepID=A0A5B7GX46_PORTR|nr:hypothetical protein [Portunus trituberculatus]
MRVTSAKKWWWRDSDGDNWCPACGVPAATTQREPGATGASDGSRDRDRGTGGVMGQGTRETEAAVGWLKGAKESDG